MQAIVRIRKADHQVETVDITEFFIDSYLSVYDISTAKACFEDDMNEGLGIGDRADWAEVTLIIN